MRTNILKKIVVFLSLSSFLIFCKKGGDFNTENYTAERKWIHENGGIYKNETLLMKETDGSIKKASLNWTLVHTFKIGQTNYTEIPFSFPDNYHSQLNGTSDNDVSFSLMIRTYNNKIEAAIKVNQRNVKIIAKGKEIIGNIDGYSNLDGVQLNMWFTDKSGKLMTMRKQLPINIKTYEINEIKSKTATSVTCESHYLPSFEFHCWLTGGAYNDTACGWVFTGYSQYQLCFGGDANGDDGGVYWPPSGGGGGGSTPPSTPKPPTPCGGDAMPNPKVAPSSASNKNGGRFGPTRSYADGSPKYHYGIDISAAPNTAVYAAFDGEVIRSISNYPSNYYGSPSSFGNLVEIRTTLPNGSSYTTLYAHLNSASVANHSTILAGTQIGLSGRTGNAQHVPFPHVHIQIRQNGILVNPEPFLATKFDNQGNSTGNPCN